MEYAGGTWVHDDTGSEIDTTFSVGIQRAGFPSIVFESRSGRSGQGAGRNTDCKRGLQRILERFAVAGFTINAVFLDTTVTRRKYFALLASPDRFDIRAASAALATDYWIVPRPTAKRGDRIIVWQPMDKDRRRGVVAFGEVTEPATERGPDPAGARFWKSGASRPEIALRIGVRCVVPTETPLWLDDDLSGTLAGLSVSRGQGNTLFIVTDSQWDAVVELSSGWPHGAADAGRAMTADHPDPEPQTASGQGRSSNAARNKAIELRAMDVVTARYLAQGWQVTDTSATKPYDLVCTDPSGHDHFFEVKGMGGTGPPVTVTQGEVSHARRNLGRVSMAIVSGINSGPAPSYTATGGTLSYLELWDPDTGTLVPTQYRFTPPVTNPNPRT